MEKHQQKTPECWIENPAFRCSCSNCDFNECLHPTLKREIHQEQQKQYLASVTMADQTTVDDPVIQQVLKYVASIHSKLSKHSVAQKVGGNPNDWQYVIVKGKEGTKFICKRASNKSLNGTQKAKPVSCTGGMSAITDPPIAQDTHINKNLAYIFGKCSVPKQKSCTSICTECKNTIQNQAKLIPKTSDVCSECQKLDEICSNQFASYASKYHKQEHVESENNKTLNSMTGMYDYLCEACQSAIQQHAKGVCISCGLHSYKHITSRCADLCRFDCCSPFPQTKSVIPEVCAECRALLNRNELYSDRTKKYPNTNFGATAELCPGCKTALNSGRICSQCSFQSVQSKYAEMELCSECQRTVNAKKGKFGYDLYQSNVTSKETCIGCQPGCDLKGECPFCFEYLGTKTYMNQKDNDSINKVYKTCNKERETPQEDLTKGTNCKTYQPTKTSQGMCNRCESIMDPLGLYQTCVGVDGNNLARPDILSAIMQAYQACSCKVCECFSSKSGSILTDAPCQCKPCECPDCTQMAMKRSGYVFTTFPCFVQNDNCTCRPCDCIKCAKVMTTATDCDCQSCHCIMCNKIEKIKDTNVALDQDNIDVTRSECVCSPCQCTNCRKNAAVPAQTSRHEVSTDTATFRHLDCICDDCVTETCQSLSTNNCLCARKYKVMTKPFGRISNDFDIRTATIRTSNALKNSKLQRYSFTPYAALTSPMFISSKPSRSNRATHQIGTSNLQVKPKDSCFVSSVHEYNEIEQNLLSSQKKFARKNSSFFIQSEVSSNREMSGLGSASLSQLSVQSSSNIAAKLLDISNHQLSSCIGKSVNNVNITLYAHTYSNPLGNPHNENYSSEKKTSSSQVTHTSSYTNDIPTKDETDSCEFGCVREIKTRTRTPHFVIPNNLEEEYHAPIYKTKKTINSISLNSKKSCEFENHTSSSYVINLNNPKETSSEFNKSSTSTNISQSNAKVKESKSTQDHLKVVIYKNGKNSEKNITKCITDAETHISSTSLLVPYNAIDMKVSSTSKTKSLHDHGQNNASVSNIAKAPTYFEDVELKDEYKAQLTGMSRFPETIHDPYIDQSGTKSKWIKENDSTLKRIYSEYGAGHSDSARHNAIVTNSSEEYRKDQSTLKSVQAFSEQQVTVLQIFEAMNEEFQTFSKKINVFNGRIDNELYRVREMIKNNDFYLLKPIPYRFPISHQYFTTADRHDKIAVYNPDNIKNISHEDIKLKNVSFNNVDNKQTAVRTYTNQQYDELSKNTQPDSLTDIPVFENDYAQFVVYNLDSKTVDVIDVDNHVTVGEIPFQKEKVDKLNDSYDAMPSTIQDKDNLKNDINRCDSSGDNSVEELNVESKSLKVLDIEIVEQLEFDDFIKSDDLSIHETHTVQRQKSYIDIRNTTLKKESGQTNDVSPAKETMFTIVQSETNGLCDLQDLFSPEYSKDFDNYLIMNPSAPNLRQPNLQLEKNQLTINCPANTMVNSIVIKEDINVQTSENHIDLKDFHISSSYKNFMDIFSPNNNKEQFQIKESKMSFFGKGNRVKCTSGKITCEYLKVSDLCVRKISNHSVVVEWKKPMAYNQVCGYELLIDGKAVNKSLGPSECMAVVRCLPEINKLLITVKTMPKKIQELDHHPSSTVVFVRE